MSPAISLSWFIVQAALAIGLGSTVVLGLRTLRRLDRHAPATGARRVPCRLRPGDEFPVMFFPPELARRLQKGNALVMYGGPVCGLCRSLVQALPPLARQYREFEFVLFSEVEWNPFAGQETERLSVVTSRPLVVDIGVTMEPYAIRTVDGRVTDFGVVNSPEHVESLLLSRRRA